MRIGKEKCTFFNYFVEIFCNIRKKAYLCTIKITNNRAAQLVKHCTKIMKTFEIYPFGSEYPIVVRGNHAAYMRSINSGEYRHFEFEIVEMPEWMKLMVVRASNDRNSNRGHWYAHSVGYNMDAVLRYDGKISVNTYHNYRKVCVKKTNRLTY